MRGIGAFVLLLLVAVGVVGYAATRPPDRDLDLQEQAWVRKFRSWRDTTERRVDAASAGIGFTSAKRNARLLEPLRGCTISFGRLGLVPTLLESVEEASLDACGQAEHAVAVNDRFAFASLATTRLHLNQAGDRLQLAARNLRTQLGESPAS